MSRCINRWGVAILISVIFLTGLASAELVSVCSEINHSGEYVLINDITESTFSNCIEITSSDVVLDGAGFTIDGIHDGNSYGVYVRNINEQLNNITIKNITANDWGTGIYFDNVKNGNLTDNTANSNSYGIYLSSSSNNNLTYNTANSNSYGILLISSNNNSLINNTANSNSYYGMYLYGSNNNLTGNNVKSYYGIYVDSENNLIYNNRFNSTYNNFGYSNTLNTSKQSGKNIIGGSYLGGNFWANPDGTGFSELCGDADADGICDSQYDLGSGIIDYLPLTNADLVTQTPEINNCTLISHSGSYVLNQSIINSNNPTCIRITANNVSFDGAGYTVDGIDTADSKGVYVNNPYSQLTNVTIKNLIATDWGTGFYYENTQNGSIVGSNASSNYYYGIYLSSSINFTIINNTANSNIYYGIYLGSSINNTLKGNNVSNNHDTGIYLDSSSNSILINNSMIGNTYNFFLYGNQNSHFDNFIDTSNTVDEKPILYIKNGSNTVYNSSSTAGTIYCIWCNNITINNMTLIKNGYGIYFWDVMNSKVENITASNNHYSGIYLSSSSNINLTDNTANSNNYGIFLSSSNNNNLTDNTADSNSYGMYLYGSNNNLTGNNVKSYYGIYVDSENNLIYNNRFNSTYNNFGYSNTLNTSKQSGENIIGGSYLGGNFWANPYGTGFSETCGDADSDGICDLQYDLGSGIVDYLPLTTTGQGLIDPEIDSCTRISFSGNYVLNQSIVDSDSTTCIMITANNVSLDGAGYTVDGIDASNSKGVYVNNPYSQLTNVTIKNLTATDWGTGINYENTQNGSIIDSNASSNSYYGIYLSSSINITIINNTANSNNNYGMYLSSSNNNNLTDNTANSNSYGIYLSSSSNNLFSENTAYLNSYGIILSGGSSNNITRNNLNSGLSYGIYVSSSNNLIYNNRFNSTNNYFNPGYSNAVNTSKQSGENIIGGSYLGGNFWAKPDGTGFSETCGDADSDGICDSQYDLGSGIVDYLPLTTTGQGLIDPEIDSCTRISFSGNYVLNQSIVDSDSITCITITANNVSLDGAGYTVDGIDASNSKGVYVNNPNSQLTNVTIKNLTATDWRTGIYYENTRNGSIVDSNASSNSIGIYFILSSNNNITDNIANSNSYGIQLSSSNNNNLTDNIADSNSYGIYLNGGSQNNITRNKAKFSSYGIYINSDNNLIYNNQFNSSSNYITTGNKLNITKTEGINLIGGTYLGGNSWIRPDGTGFSELCGDADADGICDSQYNLGSGIIDYLPLTKTDLVTQTPEINNCTIISRPGSYVLNQSIINSNNPTCIRITANNVSLDGAGYTVDGIDASNSKGVYVNNPYSQLTNVTIKNLTATDWGTGIYYENTRNGIIVGSNSSSNSIGIYFISSSNNNITDNIAISNSYGMYFSSSDNNNFKNNIASSNSYGIYLSSSSNNLFSENTAYLNSYGIILSGGSSNNITRNNVNSDYNYGIYVSSSNNLIYNNRFNSTNNYFNPGYSNTLNASKQSGENIIGGSYLGGNFWAKPDGTGFSETCGDADSDGICDSQYNLGSRIIDYLPLTITQAPEINNCTVISRPGSYTLNQSIINSKNSTCITITANNVSLDGAGYTVDGIDASNSKGVYANNPYSQLTNVTIKNLTATDWRTGIYYENTRNGSIVDSNASSNYYGVYLSSSSNNLFSENTAYLNSYGFIMYGGSSNNITRNNVNSGLSYGIYVSSSNNLIYNNRFNSTNNYFNLRYSNTLNASKQSGENIIGGSYLGGNFWAKPDGTGFSETCGDADADGICDSQYNLGSGIIDYLPLTKTGLVKQNPEINNCTLISLPGSYVLNQSIINSKNSTCIRITANNVSLDGAGYTVDGIDTSNSKGVYVNNPYSQLTNVTINNLTATDWRTGINYENTQNGSIVGSNVSSNYYGIFLSSSINFTIINNTAISNSNYGIYLSTSINNTISSNNASNNDEGIYLSSSINNTISGNNASNNYDTGIYLDSSINNTLNSNNALNNDYIGIYLDSSINNTLNSNNASKNYASNNYDIGIYLYSSSNSILINNSMIGNSYNFILYGSQNSHFDNFIDTSNTVDGKPILYIKNGSNTVYNSSSNAGTIYCIWCNNITINNITLIKNGYGVFFWNVMNSNVENITASNNENSGIYLSSSSNNKINGNNVSNNENSGIYLSSSRNNTLNGNNASNNDEGIYLSSSSKNNITGNTANSNYYGFYLGSSNNNSLIDNTAISNSNYGIYLSSSNNNSLTDNTASNSNYGIYFGSSNNNSLTDNTANSNSNYGIYLGSSNNNSLTDNIANSNSNYGIYLASSINNNLTRNSIKSGNGIYITSGNNLIYNNQFNSSGNYIATGNKLNITKTEGLNLIGGPYLGGNFWIRPDRTGFSDTCGDADSDGICDSIYNLNSGTFDYLPLASTGQGIGSHIIDNCTLISLPGDYVLNNSITDSSSAICIRITSSDVTLDGAGFTVDGIDAGNSYGVYVRTINDQLNNVTIKNINVTDWGTGIYFDNVKNGNVTDNSANSNSNGISFSNSNNFNLINNTANRGSGTGISFSNSGNFTLINNTASSNSGYGLSGISLTNSNNFTLINNTASSNSGSWGTGSGISLSSSSNNSLTDNIANSNNNGITLSSSNNNSLLDNTANSNSYGIQLSSSSNNNLTDNTADSNSYGIYLNGGSQNNITRNKAKSSSYGIYVSSNNNLIYNNQFNSSSNYIAGSNTLNTSKQSGENINGGSYLGGNFWANPVGTGFSETCSDVDLDGICDSKYDLGSGNFDFLPLTAAGLGTGSHEIDSCRIISLPGEYVLNNSITNSSSATCIIITSGNVTLDGAGFTVDGIDTGNSYGVYVKNINDQLNNVTIKNINVTDWGTGIYFDNVKNGNVTDTSANSNSNGIFFSNSNNFNLINNTANLGSGTGISFTNSGNFALINNTASSNYGYGGSGISLTNSNNFTLTNNTASSNNNYWGSAPGISLSSSSNNNLTDNMVNSNSYGIQLGSSSNNNLTDNILNLNNYGIQLSSSSNNNLTDNNVNSNYNGIRLSSSSNNNLKDNIVSSNSYGISLDYGSNNTITRNNVKSSNGIHVNSEKNLIYNNRFNSTNNYFNPSYSNTLNTSRQSSENIIGGSYLGGNFWENPVGTGFSETCNDEGMDGICDSPYNLSSGNLDYLPLTVAGLGTGSHEIDSCRVISLPGDYVLNNSITNSSSATCIIITSSNVTLDGAGFTVDGIDTGNSYGVYVKNINDQLNNVTIKNINVTDWGTGIYFDNVKNGNLTDTSANSNSNGISFSNSNNFNLINNTANLGSGTGISFTNSGNFALINNTASSNYGYGGSGISLTNSDNFTLINNTASSNSGSWGTGSGISLSSSNNNNLLDNTANSNSYGIQLSSSSNNNLTENTADSNGYGIYLNWGSQNNITRNKAKSSSYGIYVSSSNNLIYNNQFNSSNNYITTDNKLNITKTEGINLIGGPYLGGNLWVRPDRTGFSDKCDDMESDGICDTLYDLGSGIIDYLPLKYVVQKEEQVDLISTDITWVSSNVSDGQIVTFNTSISNIGIGNVTKGFYTKFTIDGINIGEQYLSGLASDSSSYVTQAWTATPGQHNVTAEVDSHNDIPELNETNNSRTMVLPRVEQADLIVSGLSWSPSNFTDGQAITFNAIIENMGIGNTTRSFSTRFLIDEVSIGEKSISGLSSGNTTGITQTWTTTPGEHKIKAIVDIYSQVSESNETNNSLELNLTKVEPADLIVSSLTWAPSDFSDGQVVTFNAAIANIGIANTSRGFNTRFLIDGVSIGDQYLSGLTSGSSRNVIQTWTATPGEHVIKAEVDIQKHVTESNETNNSLELNLTKVNQSDLTVSGLSWTPSTFIDGQSVKFNVTIKNIGIANTSQTFYTSFLIDNVLIGSGWFSGLASGSSANADTTWIATPGEHTIKAIVDANNNVVESNELNNSLEFNLTKVDKADLIVSSLTWTPSDFTEGQSVTFNAVIENAGNGNTTRGFYTRFLIDDNYIGDKYFSGLSLGSSTYLSQTWVATPGDHTIKAVVDANNHISESNETNNSLSKDISYIQAEYLLSTGIRESYAEGEIATFSAFASRKSSPAVYLSGSDVSLNLTLLDQGGNTLLTSPMSYFYQFFFKDVDLTGYSKGSYTALVKLEDANGVVVEKSVPFKIVQNFSVSVSTDRAIYDRDEIVQITGHAQYPDGSPVANAPVVLSIKRGYTQTFSLVTGSDGSFYYYYNPYSWEAGNFTIGTSVISDKLWRSAETSFKMYGLYMTPSGIIDYTMSKNSSEEMTFTLKNYGESTLHGVSVDIVDENTGEGVDYQIMQTPTQTLLPNAQQLIKLKITAGNVATSDANFSISVTTDEGSHEEALLKVYLVEAVPIAFVNPTYITAGMNPDGIQVRTVNVSNLGYESMNNVNISKPNLDWITTTSIGLGNIAPYESKSFDIILHPTNDTAPGVYKDNITISSSNHNPVKIYLTISVTSSQQGDLMFHVVNDIGENISGASITIQNQDVFTEVFKGTTNQTGYYLFDNISIGRYTYIVRESGHDSISNSVIISPEIQTLVEPVLLKNILGVQLSVTPITIGDTYDIQLNLTFETEVPPPVLMPSPLFISYGINFTDPENENDGSITISNPGLISIFNVTVNSSLLAEVNISFPTGETFFIDEIKAKSSVTIPYHLNVTSVSCGEDSRRNNIKIRGDYIYFEENNDVTHNVYLSSEIPVFISMYNCPVSSGPTTVQQIEQHFRYSYHPPGGSYSPGTTSPTQIQYVETVRERVKLSISQQATLERDAFAASLELTNKLADKSIENVKASLEIKDNDGSDASGMFYVNQTFLDNINSIDGSGVIDPSSIAIADWLLVPKPGAGGTTPAGKDYTVQAFLDYSVDGVSFSVNSTGESINVMPQPLLNLTYTIPGNVTADTIFNITLNVTNVGYGVARNLKLDSAQPMIYENNAGLLVSFTLIGSGIKGGAETDSMLINFGDIAPGGNKTGYWIMKASLDGEFTEFKGSFSHNNAFGGAETSLINNITYVIDKLVVLKNKVYAVSNEAVYKYQLKNSDIDTYVNLYHDPFRVNKEIKNYFNVEKQNLYLNSILSSVENDIQKQDIQNIIDTNTGSYEELIHNIGNYVDNNVLDKPKFENGILETFFTAIKIPKSIGDMADFTPFVEHLFDLDEISGMVPSEAFAKTWFNLPPDFDFSQDMGTIGYLTTAGEFITVYNDIQTNKEFKRFVNKNVYSQGSADILKTAEDINTIGKYFDNTGYFTAPVDIALKGIANIAHLEPTYWCSSGTEEELKYIFNDVCPNGVVGGRFQNLDVYGEKKYTDSIGQQVSVYTATENTYEKFYVSFAEEDTGQYFGKSMWEGVFGKSTKNYWNEVVKVDDEWVPVDYSSLTSKIGNTLLSFVLIAKAEGNPINLNNATLSVLNTEDSNSDGIKETMYVDMSNDGFADIILIDSNEDGYFDVWKFIFNNTNITGYDLTGEGVPSAFDINDDGKIEAWDLDGNRKLDKIDLNYDGIEAYDMNNDGYIDTFVEYNKSIIGVINSAYHEFYLENQTVTLNASVYDGKKNGTPPYSFEWESDLDGYIGEGKLIQTSNLSIGNHTISLKVQDNNGLSDTEAFMVTILNDVFPPASITNIQYSSLKTGINWTWTNPLDSDFNHTEIYLDGAFLTNVTVPQNYFNITDLTPDTQYEFSTHTADTSGNINTNWVNATARTLPISDITPPTITFISPTDPSGTVLGTRSWIFINVSLSDPGSSWLEWNGTNESMSGSGANWYINKTDLANGVYTYRVWANDSGGNLNVSETRTIEISYITDTLPPIITIVSPVNNTTYMTDSVDLNYSVNEPTIWQGYSLDGEGNITLSENTTLTGLIDGIHTLVVYANDTSGNMNSSTVSFTIDNMAPVINSVTLNNSTPNTNDVILVTVNATDNIGVAGVAANGASLTNQGGSIWNGTIIALAGTHSVNVSASDAASNTGWNNSTSYTATTPPIPGTLNSINVTPDPKTLVIGETQTFTASPKDQYGAPLSISVTWSSSNTTVGRVDAGTGHFTALVAGTTMVNATNGSVTGTAIVTVNARPSSTNLIRNPGFESGTADWNNWGITFITGAPASEGAKSANIGIITSSSNMQLYQYGITLEPKTRYRLSFSAYSNTGHDMTVKLFKHGSPYTGYGLIQNYDLTTGWQEFSTEFTSTGFSSKVIDARLMFWFVPFGKSGDKYYIDNVGLEKVTSQDTIPPTVTAGTPVGANVPVNTQITVTFSEMMDQTSAQSAFSTTPATTGSFSWSGSTMTYTLNSNLENSKTYNATVETGARDLAGNSLLTPYSWEFTTVPDTIPPTVTGGSPMGINVPVNTQITVTFSEAMNKTSAQSAFSTSISTDLNPATIGSFSWSGNTMTYKLLSSNLNNSTTYNATVGTGARDLAGNSLLTPYSWEFTTMAVQPSINIVKNPGFESGKAYWTFYTNGRGTFSLVSPGYVGNNASELTLSSWATNIQLYQTGIILEPNTRYRLSFAAYSTTGHDMTLNLIKHGSPYTNYGLVYIAGLGTGWQTFTTEFTTKGFTGTVNNGRLMFYLAGFAKAGDRYYIDNVQLEKVI